MARPTRHRDKWRIRWVDHSGKRRSEVYGTFKDAQTELHRHKLETAEIKSGHRSPLASGKLFSELADYWLTSRASRKRSARDDRSIIERHLRPAFGELQLTQLSVAHVDAFVAQRRHLSPKTVHNQLTLLISMLNVAVDLGWLREIPRIKKPKIHIAGEDYRYLRSAAEIEAFLRAAKSEDEITYNLYATAIYTGLRAGELAGLHWDDIDFERRLITVRRSYSGPTKSGKIRHVPILDPLLPVLRAWRLRHGGALVFTNRDGRMLGRSARAFQEVLHRVLERAGFESSIRNGRRRWYITFHGLRHTFASHWVMSGGDIFKLQRILGHASVEMTMRYAHLAPDAFAGDLGRIADHVPREGRNVLSLGSARRNAPSGRSLVEGGALLR